jgi:hypothetical protein
MRHIRSLHLKVFKKRNRKKNEKEMKEEEKRNI